MEIEAALNITTRLCGPRGVARVFGPQKGATPDTIAAMEQALVRYAAVVERDGLFLLVEEHIGPRLVLNQPAGHLEDNETLIEAAIRETLEESAWHFAPQSLVGVYLWKQPENGKSFLHVAIAGAAATSVGPCVRIAAHGIGDMALFWRGPPGLVVAPRSRRAPLEGAPKPVFCCVRVRGSRAQHGGCSSGVERLTVAQEVAGSKPVTRPILRPKE